MKNLIRVALPFIVFVSIAALIVTAQSGSTGCQLQPVPREEISESSAAVLFRGNAVRTLGVNSAGLKDGSVIIFADDYNSATRCRIADNNAVVNETAWMSDIEMLVAVDGGSSEESGVYFGPLAWDNLGPEGIPPYGVCHDAQTARNLAATADGLYKSGSWREWEQISLGEGVPTLPLHAVHCDPHGAILVGTRDVDEQYGGIYYSPTASSQNMVWTFYSIPTLAVREIITLDAEAGIYAVVGDVGDYPEAFAMYIIDTGNNQVTPVETPHRHLVGIDVVDGMVVVADYMNGAFISYDEGSDWSYINAAGANDVRFVVKDGELVLWVATDYGILEMGLPQ